jgi:hypothetical protein
MVKEMEPTEADEILNRQENQEREEGAPEASSEARGSNDPPPAPKRKLKPKEEQPEAAQQPTNLPTSMDTVAAFERPIDDAIRGYGKTMNYFRLNIKNINKI